MFGPSNDYEPMNTDRTIYFVSFAKTIFLLSKQENLKQILWKNLSTNRLKIVKNLNT